MIVPGSASPLLTTTDGGYTIPKSLRFRSSASAYLGRTPGSSSNTTTWTWSGWVKLGYFDSSYNAELFNAGYTAGTTNYQRLFFFGNNLYFDLALSNTLIWRLATNAVYRDYSSWYHIVAVSDTTNATASNRARLYVNGVQVTSLATASYPPQNQAGLVNTVISHNISSQLSGNYFEGYMADVNFIDGQALTPSSFGETDSVTGVWKPKAYSGTYGTNGFYLKFTDVATTSGSNAGLGKDFSGNGNYWNTNNISVTSGATYDSMKDVPTLTDTDTANYCVLNPLDKGALDVTEGNLTFQRTSSITDWEHSRGTIQIPSTGKWYWESKFNSGTNDGVFNGVATSTANLSTDFAGGTYAGMYGYSSLSGNVYNNNTNTTLGSSLSNGDVIMIAVDVANTNLWIGVNGTWLGSGNPATNTNASIGSIPTGVFPVCGSRSTGNGSANFGQRPFSYTPPTGFKSLNTYNLPDSTIKAGNKYMDATIWTGDGNTSRTIATASSFKPDLVWIKQRSIDISHTVYDTIRGASTGSTSKSLVTNATAAEGANNDNSTYGYLDSFTSTGFTTVRGSNGTTSYTNANGGTYVAWQWQAGQGTTSSNTNGSITSTVSVNATAGFSIVTYTGTGTTGTVGHGLGVAPKMVIVKARNQADSWLVYHAGNPNPATNTLILESTGAVQTSSLNWNSTAPTSSVFSVYNPGSGGYSNGNGYNYVAYCWAEIAGFSKFGSYTGNGSADGPFVHLGFRPKFILVKNSTTGGVGYDWYILDSARDGYNQQTIYLKPNTSGAEEDLSSSYPVDFLSNGFKIRNNATGLNGSGGTYIFMAFAENPQKLALAR